MYNLVGLRFRDIVSSLGVQEAEPLRFNEVLDDERMRDRRLGTLDPALNVITEIKKDKYMEIITASVSILFAICLAALAITPTLIGIYLELRAQKRHGAQQNVSKYPRAYPPPVPFNSQIFWRSVGSVTKHGPLKADAVRSGPFSPR